MITCKGCGIPIYLSLRDGQWYHCPKVKKGYIHYNNKEDEEYTHQSQKESAMKKYWVKVEHLVHEETSVDMSTNPNYVEVVKTEDLINNSISKIMRDAKKKALE